MAAPHPKAWAYRSKSNSFSFLSDASSASVSGCSIISRATSRFIPLGFPTDGKAQETTAIPYYPLRPRRAIAADPEPKYVTFVNPQPAKGASVVARVAMELGRTRPEIPLLVVQGRGGADGLAVDLSGLANLHRTANTPDPRDFYRVTRAVLAPSLWRETFRRVAAEALANGLPVLTSDRGALPETLGEAGFCFHVPPRCGPDGRQAPTPREAAPWVATIAWLWDDAALADRHRDLARAEASLWDDAALAGRYLDYFARISGDTVSP